MGRTLVFLLGLVALGLLIYFCYRNNIPRIEHDLKTRTTIALGQNNFQFATVEVDGRDIRLEGVAPDVDARKLAGDEAKAVWGVNSVDNRLEMSEPTVEPVASPYRTVVTCNQESAVLTGVVPDEESRAWLVGVTGDKRGKGKVRDKLEIAEGSPENWRPAMKDLMGKVDKFDDVKIELVDAEIFVTGLVKSSEMQTKLQESINADLPSNFHVTYDLTLEGQDASPVADKQETKEKSVSKDPQPQKPYATKIALKDKEVILSGFVPDEEAQLRLVNAFKTGFGADHVRDKLEIAPGASAGWKKIMESMPVNIHQFDTAEVSLIDKDLTITGTVLTEEQKEKLQSTITEALPDGVESKLEITVTVDDHSQVRDQCQQRINNVLAESKILFGSGSAKIQTVSFGILDRLAVIFKDCQDMEVEVAGHTDSRGDEKKNLSLSSARAASVVTYLTGKGITADRLHAKGYGEARPVADNETEQGQAKNRRIEFKVGGK